MPCPTCCVGRVPPSAESGRAKPRLPLLAAGLTGCVLLTGAPTVAAQDGPRTERHRPAPLVTSAESTDWPLHNRDLQNSRYAPIAQIDTTNVATLEVAWSYQVRGLIRSMTPLVVDGMMYVNSGSTLYALDAATGAPVWTFQDEPSFAGGGRGPAYADARVYAFGSTVMDRAVMVLGDPERFRAVGRLEHVVAACGQHFADQRPHVGVVLGQEDRLGSRTRRRGGGVGREELGGSCNARKIDVDAGANSDHSGTSSAPLQRAHNPRVAAGRRHGRLEPSERRYRH